MTLPKDANYFVEEDHNYHSKNIFQNQLTFIHFSYH